jgi:hypothetical protein
MPVVSYEQMYAARHSRFDPYPLPARDVPVDEFSRHRDDVRLGHEIVPDARYVPSEFFVDFARPSSRRYMMGGLVNISDLIPIGFHDYSVDIQVNIGQTGAAWFLGAEFNIRVPGFAKEVVEAIARSAHQICPYSKSVRGNIEIGMNIVTV